MFIRRELRKGAVDIRVKAPQWLMDVIDQCALARGVTRQDLILVVLDEYCSEALAVSRVLAPLAASQRHRNGIDKEDSK